MSNGCIESNRNPYVILDLDGTLIDVRTRLSILHRDVARHLGLVPLDRQHYWNARRSGMSETQLTAGWEETARESYLSRWYSLVEDQRYLRYDRLLPGVEETLGELRQTHRLILVTMRRCPLTLQFQLKRLKLHQIFDHVLSRKKAESGITDKVALLRKHVVSLPAGSAIVGDTEEDVLAGKALGIVTIAVLTGLRGRSVLETLRPDYIVENIKDVPSVLHNSVNEGHGSGQDNSQIIGTT